ncbi:hypothetical protein D3C74_01600 [compost metagenome]
MIKATAKLLMFTLVLIFVTAGGTTATGYEPVQAADQQETVFFNGLQREENGTVYVQADRIEWYEGEAAHEIFREREGDSEMTEAPDNYYIVNDQIENEQLPIAADAKVIMQIYDRTGQLEDVQVNWNEEVPLQTFVDGFENKERLDLGDFPYHITIENGQIVKIVQQFIP